jgi:hypothetical protein
MKRFIAKWSLDSFEKNRADQRVVVFFSIKASFFQQSRIDEQFVGRERGFRFRV